MLQLTRPEFPPQAHVDPCSLEPNPSSQRKALKAPTESLYGNLVASHRSSRSSAARGLAGASQRLCSGAAAGTTIATVTPASATTATATAAAPAAAATAARSSYVRCYCLYWHKQAKWRELVPSTSELHSTPFSEGNTEHEMPEMDPPPRLGLGDAGGSCYFCC